MLNSANAMPTIPVKNLKMARDFYENKLGLKPLSSKDDQHVQLYRSGESTVELYTSEYAGTNKATSLTWTVGEDIENEVKELKSKGVNFEHYTLPKTRVEGDIHIMGDMKAAWFKDPDGNILCIHNH